MFVCCMKGQVKDYGPEVPGKEVPGNAEQGQSGGQGSDYSSDNSSDSSSSSEDEDGLSLYEQAKLRIQVCNGWSCRRAFWNLHSVYVFCRSVELDMQQNVVLRHYVPQ